MKAVEVPVCIDCLGCQLIGILSIPAEPAEIAVLIIVGGPQYRAGSHRQFTLLARDLVEHGIASLRFDYRGMGDSEGDQRNFEHIEDDIAAGCRTMFEKIPVLRSLVIWGLCDAASAAMMYASQDSRVSGLVLLNPWVHSQTTEARARLKHYYLLRLLNPAFWAKLLTGKLKLRESLSSLISNIKLALVKRDGPADIASSVNSSSEKNAYIDKMLKGIQSYSGQTLLILSGNDLTAQEFIDLAEHHPGWRKACNTRRVVTKMLKHANHTFAKHEWRDQVSCWTREWIQERTPTIRNKI